MSTFCTFFIFIQILLLYISLVLFYWSLWFFPLLLHSFIVAWWYWKFSLKTINIIFSGNPLSMKMNSFILLWRWNLICNYFDFILALLFYIITHNSSGWSTIIVSLIKDFRDVRFKQVWLYDILRRAIFDK
jgi:hypothetical protein